jgi:hypothetical protein
VLALPLLMAIKPSSYAFPRIRWYEGGLLFAALVLLFAAQSMINLFFPPFEEAPGSAIREAVMEIEPEIPLEIEFTGEDAHGKMQTRWIVLEVKPGASADDRLRAMGMVLRFQPNRDEEKVVVEDVIYASEADSKGVYFEDVITLIQRHNPQPYPKWLYLTSFFLLASAGVLYGRRVKKQS